MAISISSNPSVVNAFANAGGLASIFNNFAGTALESQGQSATGEGSDPSASSNQGAVAQTSALNSGLGGLFGSQSSNQLQGQIMNTPTGQGFPFVSDQNNLLTTLFSQLPPDVLLQLQNKGL